MAYLKARNSSLDPRFEKIAVHYMREGESLGVRWDYAVAQMAIETNYLSYKAAGGRRGDVSPSQNNFAGIGATGRGASGESFADVATGVRAHLQHLLLYAGDEVPDAVAERTRKVKEWGVLKSFHAKVKGPVTFKDLAQKWAVSSDYGVAIETHAKIFYSDFCNKPDPAPELLAEVRGTKPAQAVAAAPKAEKVSSVELARKAIETGKSDGRIETPEKAEPAVKTDKPVVADKAPKADKPATEKPAQFLTASAGGLAAKGMAPVAAGKCRVWTASYGGQRAIIIKSTTDGAVNFTVLDVNEGAEKREAEAYIAAYAKGGVVAAEFASQTQALDKAFELCPEG